MQEDGTGWRAKSFFGSTAARIGLSVAIDS
jgi:hypothetical protein